MRDVIFGDVLTIYMNTLKERMKDCSLDRIIKDGIFRKERKGGVLRFYVEKENVSLLESIEYGVILIKIDHDSWMDHPITFQLTIKSLAKDMVLLLEFLFDSIPNGCHFAWAIMPEVSVQMDIETNSLMILSKMKFVTEEKLPLYEGLHKLKQLGENYHLEKLYDGSVMEKL